MGHIIVFQLTTKPKLRMNSKREFVNNSQAWYQEHGKEEVNGNHLIILCTVLMLMPVLKVL